MQLVVWQLCMVASGLCVRTSTGRYVVYPSVILAFSVGERFC